MYIYIYIYVIRIFRCFQVCIQVYSGVLGESRYVFEFLGGFLGFFRIILEPPGSDFPPILLLAIF